MKVLVQADPVQVGRPAVLLDGEAHHLRVRRAREGERVELRDGRGLLATGHLAQVAQGWDVVVDEATRASAPAALVLAVGAGDRERFALVVEKAVELGATAVVPLETERTRSVASRVRADHVGRLRRQALEAVKQSGNPWACAIEAPVGLPEFLARAEAGERWLADVDGAAPPAALGDEACAILVGPEGGLTPEERAAALAAGFRAVALGPYTLRLETAAIAAAVLAQAARLRGRHD